MLPKVAEKATNLSYPSNKIIDITNGININNGNIEKLIIEPSKSLFSIKNHN